MNIELLHQRNSIDAPGRWRRLSATFFLLSAVLFRFSAAAACLPPPSGLTNFWAGDGNANDLVGPNNGTVSNGTTFVAGQVGSAFSFDGINDTVQIGGTPIPVPWTAEFWVKRHASPQDSAVLIGDTNTALKLEQYQNTKQVGFTRWGVADYYFNYVMPTNTWTHLVFVGTSTNTRLYVNGAIQGTTNITISLPRGQMGNDIPGRFDKPLKGLLDEVSLYNRALTAGEITSLFNAGAEGKCKTVCAPGFPDNFVCRETISGSSATVVSALGAATYEANEPLHYVRSSSNSLWYTWTAPFSGGLVFQAEGSPFFPDYCKPIVAIYTGTNISNLTKLVANSMVENSAGSDPIARAVMTVEAGQTYQIAVDGNLEFAESGLLTNTLTLTPPPVNDAFASATPISGIFYSETGTFVGAGRESGEPSHGNAALGQSLWWKWTAPTNAPSPISTRLMTDAVNFPPAVGVYTGSVVSALSSVTTIRRTNGMTSDVVFDAIPGSTYYLALAGRQSESNSVSPLIGSFHFRLNTRVLALSVTNLVTITNNSDGTVDFQANARVRNLGTNASGPLRISLFSASGVSTRVVLTEAPNVSVTSLSITNITTSLAAGQSLLVPIAGTVPAMSGGGPTGTGHAAFADLQEEPVANHWFTVDQTLVTFGEWPEVGGIIGPGGGVIRFDPGYTVSPFSPITAMQIFGATTLTEGRTTNYTGQVTFADATVQNVTNTAWSVSQFAITTNGVFTAGIVTSNTVVALTLPYSFAGITFITSTNVTVLNLPSPTITNLFLLGNTGLVFTVNGVPGRSNVIEAATNLAPPVSWLPLATNAPASGVFAFTNFSRTNIPIRFYRAREQ